jgi:hypothetical protein
MPKYRITAPTGETYEVTAPEGATQEQVMAYVQSQHQPQQAAPDVPSAEGSPAQAALPDPVKQMGAWDQLKRSTAMAGRNVAQGAMSIPGLINDPIVGLLNKGEEKLGIDPKYRFGTAAQATDYALNKVGVPDYQPQNSTERVIGRVEQGMGGLLGGNALGGVLGGTTSQTAKTVGNALQSNLGQQAGATAASTGLGGVAHEAGVSPKAEAAISLLGGMAPTAAELTAAGVAKTGARMLGTTDADALKLAAVAQREGIPLKASQLTDSKTAKLLDSASAQVPFSGGKDFAKSQHEAFNAAVGRTIGADAPKLTPEVFSKAVQKISNEFDRLTANNSIPVSPQLEQNLKTVADDAAAYYGPEARSMVEQTIQRLKDQSQNGVIPGRVFQSVDSKLGLAARSGGERSHVLGDLQEVLRDAMEQNIKPEDAAAWAQARKQWRDMRTIEPLVAKSETGDISPGLLMGRVTSNGAGKTAMARGNRGDLGDLARIGQRFMKDKVPDSGTARRVAAFEALKAPAALAVGAGSVYDPMLSALGFGGTVLTSRAIQKALRNPRLLAEMLGQGNGMPALKQAVGSSLNPTTQGLLQQGQ